ncbi:MAG: hypothetical protein LUF82_00385 [Clostridia bacterium]|nr:hypothetical protein [Clostridia bacterium]
MKKKLTALLLALCAAVSIAALAACDDENGEVGGGTDYKILLNSETAVVFTATEDVLTLSDSTSLKDYLDALVTLDQITYEGTESTYGYYITSVNGNAEQSTYSDDYSSGSGYSWMIYTSLTELDGVTYATTDSYTYTYDGVTYAYSSYGVTLLPCVEGYTYVLSYEPWSY